MIVFCDEELRIRAPKRFKDLAAALRDAFADCRSCRGRRVSLCVQDDNDQDDDDHNNNDNPIYDFDYEHQVVVSEIRSRAMEKLKQKSKMYYVDGASWFLAYSTRQEKDRDKDKDEDQGEDQENQELDNPEGEFLSVGSSFSESSSGLSKDAYVTAKTELSRSLSFEYPWKTYGLKEYVRKRSVIEELCYCEGWPFGLGRKAVLLPPLPKSPSESWSWTKRAYVSITPYI